tara:strand:+ start:225 stop:467 length:243 start_codon:yes stop_codon:yes gene_type:complete
VSDQADTQHPKLTISGGDNLSGAQIDAVACWLLSLADLIEGATNATTEADAADNTRPTLPFVGSDEVPGLVSGNAPAGSK